MITVYVPRKNEKKNPLSEYPCEAFLHNALRFLSEQKYDLAYSEICWALLKSGAVLSDTERTTFKDIEAILQEG